MSQISQLAGLLIVAVLVTASIQPLAAGVPDQAKAQKFIEIAEDSGALASRLVDQAKSRGINVSTATVLIQEGDSLLAEAKTAFSKSDFVAAFERARLAQEKFRDAAKHLNLDEASAFHEKAEGLLEAIARARLRIKSIRETLASITLTPENQGLVSQIKSKLASAEDELANAEAAVRAEPAKASEAAIMLAQAEKNIAEAFVALTQLAHLANSHRAEAFLKEVEKHVQRLKEELARLAKRGVKVDDLNAQLATVEQLIAAARIKLKNGDINGALADIQQADQLLKAIQREIAKRQKP